MMTREDTAAYTQPLVNLFTIALGYRTDHLEVDHPLSMCCESNFIYAIFSWLRIKWPWLKAVLLLLFLNW